MILRGLQILTLTLLLPAPAGIVPARADEGLIVFSAASAAAAVEDIAGDYARRTGLRVRVSAAASSVLARQIAAGAQADIFIAASPEWMKWVQDRGLIEPASRRVLMSNQLVLAAPQSSALPGDLPAALIEAAASGRIAMGDPDHVPVGQYGKAALGHLGLWTRVRARLARTPNAVAAIALIARREVPAGIVYASDVRLSRAIRTVAAFPIESHPPILYQIALVQGQSNPASQKFLAALLSQAAQQKLAARGFLPAAAD